MSRGEGGGGGEEKQITVAAPTGALGAPFALPTPVRLSSGASVVSLTGVGSGRVCLEQR